MTNQCKTAKIANSDNLQMICNVSNSLHFINIMINCYT